MKLTDEVYLVGGGDYSFNLSHRLDVHVYVVKSGDELTMIDAGFGPGTEEILKNIGNDGLDVNKINQIVITHYHADHAGGLAPMKRATGAKVLAPREAAPTIRSADADQIGLNWAKRFGFYPQDYVWEPCEVDQEYQDGDRIRVGSVEMEAIATPGHCQGHYCLLLHGEDRRYLFSSDAVFWGGAVIVQNVPDVSVQDYARSVARLAELEFDALLPGHHMISMRNGKRHVEAALEGFDRIGLPKQLLG